MFVAAASVVSFAQAPAAEDHVLQSLTTLVNAQVGFDQKAMDAVLAPDYVEVSPVGDVDARDKVIGFYAADQKPSGPAGRAALDEVTTRVYGDMAVTIARLTFTMTTPDGKAVSRAMRAVFVTRRGPARWLVVSSQFTPIRAQ